MRSYSIIGGAVLLALLSYLFLGGSVSEEERIIARVKALAQRCEIENTEQLPFDLLVEAKEISDFFTKEVNILIPRGDEHEERILSNNDIRQHVIAGKKRIRELEISLSDFDVRLSDTRAEVIASARGIGAVQGRADSFLEEHRIRVLLENQNGEWMLYGIEHLENLRD